MKLNKFFLAIQVIIASLIFTSCEDTLDVSSQIIGDGEATVDATLEFKTIATQLGKSRTPGNAIHEIKTLDVVIYNEDGSFFRLIPNVAFKDETATNETPQDYPNKPGDPNYTEREQPTAKVSFKTTLPYGRYYMYAVANLHRTLTEEEVQTIDDLKAIRCTWNDKDISSNDQMFGYFTNDLTESNTAFAEVDPEVVINMPNVALHSWIKRLASKVTVAYDGAGLHQNIVVWIHNVSIRQIPLACTLGEGNKPGPGENDIKVTSDAFDKSVTTPSQVLYYNNDGITNAPGKYDTSLHNGWLPVANGTGIVGSDHTNDSQALFFYENMQGNFKKDLPEGHELQWYDKKQKRDSVGDNIGPDNNDYRDNVPYGTFIEVEAYYQCDTVPVSNGAIRYRFMLGQDTEYNYNAIRNHHYKVTLGFNGYANQPDWHIEYVEETPEIFAPEVYIPYTYNTAVKFPIRFNGNLTGLTAEIIENNWAPFDSTQVDDVAPASVGSTDFTQRTLQFNWLKSVYENTAGLNLNFPNLLNFDADLNEANNNSGNYLYGRHKSDKVYLEGPKKGQNYYVTPIWAGFLRLQVPEVYDDEENTQLPAIIVYNRVDEGEGPHYHSNQVLTDFRNYYYGKPVKDADELKKYGADGGRGNGYKAGTNLSYRVFDVSTTKSQGSGRNDYGVEKSKDASGKDYTTVTMNLWTQPKSMCGNSGFSGNNPYEDYNRRAVIRFTATFETSNGTEIREKDVTVYQSKRLVNPKAVWRSHNNDADFNVTVMERNVKGNQDDFQALVSRGEWMARIKAGNEDGFITLRKGAVSGNEITGNTLSEIKFTINFKGTIDYGISKCAIIEVKYHGNTCVHNIFVRQGFHEPMQIASNGPYWSSYNLFSCDPTTSYGTSTGNVTSTLTRNPLSFGAFFKRGNYAQAISVSNITRTGEGENKGKPQTPGFGPLQYPQTTGRFYVTGRSETFTWANISGNTNPSWNWANFRVVLNDGNQTTRTYRVPTIAEFETLQSMDFGIGVMYGDGATAPADKTSDAYGFLDPDNTITTSKSGMRGFICYNPTNAHQIFFPVGISGIGRRTIQLTSNANQRGTLRYGALDRNLTGNDDTMRPIAFNLLNNPGSIYWAFTGTNTTASNRDKIPIAWDMNYYDLNFTASSAAVVSRTTEGGGGDALPIRLVLDGTP